MARLSTIQNRGAKPTPAQGLQGVQGLQAIQGTQGLQGLQAVQGRRGLKGRDRFGINFVMFP